jgi:hypothetical protein
MITEYNLKVAIPKRGDGAKPYFFGYTPKVTLTFLGTNIVFSKRKKQEIKMMVQYGITSRKSDNLIGELTCITILITITL